MNANIYNYKEEMEMISKHANTELKYENDFNSICEAWEKLDLKIIPFKDTSDSYIMVNTNAVIEAIESNLNALEDMSKS
jgi:hypothetical protein